jgi:creatinine amidohydrolase
MRFKDLNWMDIERYLQSDNRIIVTLGATEQHSYLSLLTDIRIPEKIADAVIGREKVLIAPPINFGCSTRFMDFPGTISIAQSTFDALLVDVIQSLLQHGFTNFLVINGHQKNHFPETLTNLIEDDYAQIVWFDWWNSDAVRAFETEHNLRVEHANWSENFAFNRVASVPIGEAEPIFVEDLPEDMLLRQHIGDGNLGGQYQINDRLMFQLLDNIVDEVVQLLIQLRPNR